MKALSIWQPWASLIAVGAKRYETRSWTTRYRGPIAIHAARHWDVECSANLSRYAVQAALAPCVGIDPKRYIVSKCDLPFGAIVAIAVLADVVPTAALQSEILAERTLGNFEPGRFAWRLERVERLLSPIPCAGRQGLWETGAFGNRMVPLEQHVEELKAGGVVMIEGGSR